MLNFTYICSLNDNSDHMVPHFFALVIFRATRLGKTVRDIEGFPRRDVDEATLNSFLGVSLTSFIVQISSYY